MTDQEYYKRLAARNEYHRMAVSKAAYRGEKSVEWHKTNILTPETLPAFKKAMKQADKEWEANHK